MWSGRFSGKPDKLMQEFSHAANEYLEEKELYRGYQIYKKTAELFLAH